MDWTLAKRQGIMRHCLDFFPLSKCIIHHSNAPSPASQSLDSPPLTPQQSWSESTVVLNYEIREARSAWKEHFAVGGSPPKNAVKWMFLINIWTYTQGSLRWLFGCCEWRCCGMAVLLETTVMWVSVTQEPEVNRVTSGPEETEMTIQDSTSLEKTSRWTKPLFVRILLFKSWSFISINPLLYRLVVFPFSWGCQDISGQMWTDEMLFAYMWHGANLTSNHWSLKQRMSWALLQTASSCLKNLPLAVERVRVWKGWPSCIVVGWDGWMWWSRQLAQHGMKLDACEMHRSQVFDFSYRNQWVQICRSSWGAHSLHHFCLKFEEIFAWTYDLFIYIICI